MHTSPADQPGSGDAGGMNVVESQQALELLLERLRKSQTNIEFLLQVQKTTPTPSTSRED